MTESSPDAESPRQGAPGHAIAFILITVLIDTIGFGMIAPVVPELISELTGEGLAGAARHGGFLMFLYAGVQFVAAPLLGNLSDRFGRRPVLLASLAALGLDYILMALAPSLTWLFVGRFIAGAAGATFATANAYVADVSNPDDRAKKFGLVSAAWGLGFILGPAFGGSLGEFGSRVPFFAAAVLSGLNCAYGWIVLPESLARDARRPFDMRRANPVGALSQIRKYPVVVGLFAVLIPYQIAHDANPAAWAYYTMLKFDWSVREVGYSLSFVGVSVMTVNALLVGPAIARLGEVRCIVLGFAAMAFGFFVFAFATHGWMLYAAIVPFSLVGIAQPALRAVMANRVPPDGQGELQGAVASLMSLTMIFSPLFMTQLFSYFSSRTGPAYFPGAPFFAAGVLGLCAIALFLRAWRRHPA